MMRLFRVGGAGICTKRFAAGVLAAGMLLVTLSAGFCVAELSGPQAVDRQVTLAITALLKREHLLRHPLDNEISERWIEQFMKQLDPMKIYFTQGDVDEFMRRKDDLDDMAKRGDVSFAYEVFKRLQQRIDERVKMLDELLAEPKDFTVDEELITDPDKLHYAKDDAEARENWRRRLKYDLLVLKSDKVEGKEAVDKLTRRYHSFAKRMRQTDSDKLLEMYLSALTTAYDPHTTYMSPGTLKNFEIAMKLKLEGIGAALQFVDGFTVVSKVIPGGAADKDGRLKPEDKVIGVGQGKSGDFVDVVDMNLDDVVKLIRGNRGTIVRLKVIPAGLNEPKVIDITRAEIELKDSEARSEIFELGKKPDGTPYKVGVINLPSFYMDMSGARDGADDFKSTTRDVARLLKEFNDKGVDACIVDLRNNGGGSLTESINLTGLFIDTGPVVQVKDADGRIQHYDDMDRGVAWNGPLVVITNKFSASASEIFAGAIQDYGRGLIIGDSSTHGKGTVQSLLDLGRQLFRIPNAPELGALKITMQQFYRPNGDSTQNRGVLADVELPSLTSQIDGESNLDHALAFDKVPAVPYKKYDLVNGQIIDRLKTDSAERRKTSEEFGKEMKKIASYNEQKKRKRVFLQEDKFMADRAELNAEKEEEKTFEEMNDPNRPVVKRDYYFNEALDITLDYLNMLKTQGAGAVGQR
jgi:carboxyl-terminal processing protease